MLTNAPAVASTQQVLRSLARLCRVWIETSGKYNSTNAQCLVITGETAHIAINIIKREDIISNTLMDDSAHAVGSKRRMEVAEDIFDFSIIKLLPK